MASSSDPLAEIVSSATVGRALKLSARRVTQLRDEGHIPGVEGGKFILGDATAAYCEYSRFGGQADGDDKVDLDLERALLARAQREGHSLKNAVLRSELLPLDDMEDVVGSVLESVRAKLLSLPTKAAPLCLGLPTTLEVRELLTGLVHDALTELASTAVVIGDIADRARRRLGRAGSNGALDAEAPAPAAADRQ